MDPGCLITMAAVPSTVTQGEATTKAHYNKVLTLDRLRAGAVIPFLIETTVRGAFHLFYPFALGR